MLDLRIGTTAREAALRFLYQCESQRVYYCTPAMFADFARSFQLNSTDTQSARRLVSATFGRLSEVDGMISELVAPRWRLERLAAMDRLVLRLAAAELTSRTTPTKVVLNEAVELAKRYGTEKSAHFVNGVLDRLHRSLKKELS